MITGVDINPRRQLYYTGALVLNILNENKNGSISLMDAFQKLHEKEQVSFNLFSLTLDWLFILNTIVIDREGIKKCF